MSSLDRIEFDERRWPNIGPVFDFKDTDAFKRGLEDVGNFMRKTADKITVGALARVFPEHQRMLLDVLEHLRENVKEVDYVDYKPLPTKIEHI